MIKHTAAKSTWRMAITAMQSTYRHVVPVHACRAITMAPRPGTAIGDACMVENECRSKSLGVMAHGTIGVCLNVVHLGIFTRREAAIMAGNTRLRYGIHDRVVEYTVETEGPNVVTNTAIDGCCRMTL